MPDLYVQYGCGWSAPKGWLNFDSSPTLRFERLPIAGQMYTKNAHRYPANVVYGDIVKGLPIPPESCRGIYCSHVLEHLAASDFEAALRNTHTHLQAGGTFRLVLPDLDRLARAYLASTEPMASFRFMEDSGLGKHSRPRGIRGFLTEWLGSSAHLWMWDERSITQLLRDHGFKSIRRAVFGDADDKKFNDVEIRERTDGALAMQCVK